MTKVKSEKFLWLLFIILSLILLTGYLAGDQHRDLSDPRLKGLTLLQHFGIHYVTGIFFGLIILISYYLITRKRVNEPLVLLLTILWSHWPDIRFAYRQLPHDPWEIIFFFHTIVDKIFGLFWLLLLVDMILLLIYLKILNREWSP